MKDVEKLALLAKELKSGLNIEAYTETDGTIQSVAFLAALEEDYSFVWLELNT